MVVGSWPDERYEEAAQTVGLACLELLTGEPRWIHRRIETIDLLARELVRRHVTVEFTLPDALAGELRIGSGGPWCVPIALLTKRPLRNFDLREHDEARPILGRDQNGPIAAALVAAAARLAVAPEALDPRAAELLDEITRGDRPEARAALAQLRTLGTRSPQVAAVLDDDTSGWLLATFAESYMLVALLPEPGGRRILKYSYDEHLQFVHDRDRRARRVAQRLGWSPLVIDIAVPTAAHAASYHAEVVVPEELRLDAFILDARTERLLSTGIERGVDRASLHAPGVSLGAEPVLIAAISAERSDVPTLAFATSAVTALVLLIGAAGGDLDSPTAGSSVALLLAGSALFTTAIARSGEHRLVRGIFAGPRWLLTIVAISALAGAAGVALGADPGLRDAIWYAGGAASALACLSLAVALRQAVSLTRRQHGADADDEPTR